MPFQVNFTDRDGDSCWADFSSESEAELYVGQWGGEILSVEEFEYDEDDQWPDMGFEDDGQPSEYDEWQDYMGGDDDWRDYEVEPFDCMNDW